MITITLNAIRQHNPCKDGWEKLLRSKGKTKANDVVFQLSDVLDSNGIDDALWCLRALGPEHHGWMRHYAVDCAEHVRHLMTDKRSTDALDIARRHADGLATDEELQSARAAAWNAAWAAGDAAWAAWAAANAAWAAARRDASHAAWAAARAAAEAAVGAAARNAECKWQSQLLREYINAGGLKS